MRLRRVDTIALALIAPIIAFACGSDPSEPEDSGSAGMAGSGRGGTAGSPAGGSSAEGGDGNLGGAAGSSSDGGVGGDQGAAGDGAAGSDGGGAGGSAGATALCDERSNGALIDFEIASETLRVWIENETFIDEALMLLDNGESRIPLFNTLLDGQDCDAQWTWHPDPQNVEFADFTIELCDGLPSHIEEDKSYWFDTVSSYCPWSAQVTAIDDRR